MTSKKDYFKTFCKISKAFGSTLKRDELLDLIVESAIETMDAQAASLFLEDKEKDVFVSVCQKGLSENYLHSDPYRVQKMSDELVTNGYLAFEDVATDQRIYNRQTKLDEGIASILVVPVTVEGKIIGVLSLYTADVRKFSQDEIEYSGRPGRTGAASPSKIPDCSSGLPRTRSCSMTWPDSNQRHEPGHQENPAYHDGGYRRGLRHERRQYPAGERGYRNAGHGGQLRLQRGIPQQRGRFTRTRASTQALEGETVIIQDATTDDRIEYKDAMKKERHRLDARGCRFSREMRLLA